MLDVINGLANGWVITPVIDAFARRRLFEALAQQPMRVETLVQRYRANEGHLRAALLLLYELGWLDTVETDFYAANRHTGLVLRLPSDIRDLVGLPVVREVKSAQEAAAWSGWLANCMSGWSGTDPVLAGVLDGALLAPLLAGLYEAGSDGLEGDAPKGWNESGWQAVRTLFVQRGWGSWDDGAFRLTAVGRSLLASSGALGTVVSYAPMFRRMEELLFGDAAAVFDTGEQRHESHLDRTLNVTASGFQHQSHFAELEALIVRLFDDLPLEAQPRYIVDMGCGDGTLLRRTYEVVRTRTARGEALGEYPLTLIGADYNALALEAARRTLAGLPHCLVHGNIAEPQQLLIELANQGITEHDRILHIRSFLDHDRRFEKVEDQTGAQARRGFDYSGVYVASDGSAIAPAEAVQSLVEHLRRWRAQMPPFGLVLLELHCLRPSTVRRLQNQTESLYFDAFHAFSGQQLVEASVFVMAAAEAALFPEPGVSRLIPKTADFTRISLHRLLPQPYRVRHPLPSDLIRLTELDRLCVPEALRTPVAELERRVSMSPRTQMVLEMDGQIVAALYAQRIDSIEALRDCLHRDLAQLQRAEGRVLQLLGLYVAPDKQGHGYSDALIDLMLTYAAALDGVDTVVGITRCVAFGQYNGDDGFEGYIRLQRVVGQWSDPMLEFHASHGARIHEVLHGFRPEDTENQGAGILIEYRLREERQEALVREAARHSNSPTALTSEQIEAAVRGRVLQVLGNERAGSYGAQVPLMEMGLSSLELLELRRLLSETMGETLEATFFFRYGTPTAVLGYFVERAQARSVAQISIGSDRAALMSPQQKENRADEALTDGSIAIIGMACRLPGGIDDPTQFWQALIEGRDLVGALPAERNGLRGPGAGPFRWQGGFLHEVDRFDAGFFRISPREAEWLDPQQRLLLEVSWEALERAGIAPLSLRGSCSGVFVGMMGSDYQHLLAQRDSTQIEAHFATGNASSVAAGRLSYFLDWQGPALSIDTACSSSLVAVHTACRSLLSGECELALAAGVNLLLDDKTFQAYENAGMLSPGGRCKSFDASADGYVRGEGCGALILKRLVDAQAEGDSILAVIRGSAINQDGSGSGLTAPNQRAQQVVIEAALARAAIAPSTIAYLEAHGTGTSLGDPIEVLAAAQVLGRDRPKEHPLLIGSAKCALGHLEAAAGIAGLIKTVLSIQHDTLPAQLHFSTPNPHIPWERLPVRVVARTQAWPAGLKRASVSSFGFSGTNAHLIVEEYVAPEREAIPVRGPVAVVLSARSEERLQAQVTQLLTYLHGHEVNLVDLAYTLQVGREALGVRLAAVVNSVEELKGKLAQVSQNNISGLEDLYLGEVKRTQETLAVFKVDEDLEEAIGKWIAKGKVSKLAELWVQGLVVNWAALYGEPKPQRLSLPSYPFAQERYWVPAAGSNGQANAQKNSEPQLHPLVHRNTSNLSEQRYSTTLSGEEFYLRDHVVGGKRIVPGVAQLEWARAAVGLALDGMLGGDYTMRLEQVSWLRPLVVASALEVHIGLLEEEKGRISYEIYSGQGEEAVVYSQGYGVVVEGGSQAPRSDLTTLVEQCDQTQAQVEIYKQFRDSGLDYGASF
ncbi:MAG TPA: type I polyketide synthase, partial [Silvibacterium sp.]|nr:type I polyketide synthase [Silvibacterium sp.]